MQDGVIKSAAGIDIGGTKMMLFLSDEDGRVVDKRKLPIPANPASGAAGALCLALQIRPS